MSIEVTSVSRHAETVQEAPAAIFVITREDIRRSGARTIPELLRQVPGLHVARIGDINTYAVSSRGFADRLSDKLEVLVDGRSVYSPLFSGVFWDTVDEFLPDIERIEVIRGPGAALWGTNAITGVINIVTRHAVDTRGTYGYAGGGTEERSAAGVRTGGMINPLANLRLYAKAYERDGLKDAAGNDTFTVARYQQAGFRGDAVPWVRHAVTVSGDLYQSRREDLFESPAKAGDVEASGGNLNARWTWEDADQSELAVQAFYESGSRLIPAVVFRVQRAIGSLEVQQRFPIGDRNTVLVGGGYRQSRDATGGAPMAFTFSPRDATLDYYSAFLQDQLAITPAVALTLGSRFEHNDYTGWETEPTARLGWTAGESLFTWAAVSRAVRTPNRLDHDSTLFGVIPTGNPHMDTEKVVDYEWGLRFSRSSFSADLALFYDTYNGLRSQEPNPPFPFGQFGNGIQGHGQGGELSLGWQPVSTLDLRLTYSFIDIDLHTAAGSADSTTARGEQGSTPSHQAGLRVAWQPAAHWNANAFLRYVGAASLNSANGEVPAYTELNLHLAWQVADAVEVSLTGENLLDAQHGELRSVIGPAYVETPRSGMLEVSWRWD